MDDALRPFFVSFERFQFAQCNDMLKSRMTGTQPTNALFAPLLLLSSAEGMYQALTYLESRPGKKEQPRFRSKSDADALTSPLSSIFSQLINELKRIESQMQDSESRESNQVIVFVQELCGLLTIRQELAAIYNGFAMAVSVPQVGMLMTYDEVAERLVKLQGRLSGASKHPLLLRWKSHILTEVTILHGLVSLQLQLSRLQFIDSVLACSRLKASIEVWRRAHTELKTPPLFLWLFKFYVLLVGKMSFYFHRILSREEEIGDVRSITAKNELDFISSVENFFMRGELQHLSVVVDVGGLNSVGVRWSSQGHCFVGPDEHYEPPSGLNSWPVILSLPADTPPKEHWPNVVSIIMDNPGYFARTKEPLSFAEKHLQVTYFISQLELQLYIVVILGKDKRKHEVAVKSFVDNIAKQLRNEMLFARLLKPT